MSLRDWVVGASVCGIAIVLFGMPTVASFAANDQFQSGADLLGTPQPKPSGPPENTGTPEETAKLAAAAGKYDIAGMKLGTPLKEAMQALKAHNPKLQMKKDTIKYDVLGGELLYGLTFTSPEERFIFGLTMPPNPIVVSKLARTMIFTKETAPTQQALVEDLIKKYGTPSYDNGANQLNDANLRIINWLDDANGSRMKDENGTMCISSQSFTGLPERTAEAAQMQPMGVSMALESRWAVGQGDVCETRRMVQARLKRCCQNALAAPDLVGALAVLMGDGPLDVQATGATHELLVNAVKAKDAKEKEGAQKNRPKL
ncbi:MAG: hypothetical protein ABIR36_15820 [Nitrospiraceae bacterium]